MIISSSILKQIDHWAWKPVLLLSLILRFLFPWRQASEKTAIIRSGGLGDLVLLTMAFRDLGLSTENVVFFIQKRSEPWAKYLGLDFISVDSGFEYLCCEIFKYKNIINSEQYFGLSTAFAKLISRPDSKILGFETNIGAAQMQTVGYDPLNTHEIQSFKNLLSSSISLTPANQISPDLSVKENFICLSISGLDSESRRMDTEKWKKFVGYFYNSEVVKILASPTESSFARNLALALSADAIDCTVLTGDFSIQVGELKKAKLLLAMDGGMVHVASYLNIPTICLFTSGRDLKWAPLVKDSMVLRRYDLSCQPCTIFGQVPKCLNQFKCCDIDEILIQNKKVIPLKK